MQITLIIRISFFPTLDVNTLQSKDPRLLADLKEAPLLDNI